MLNNVQCLLRLRLPHDSLTNVAILADVGHSLKLPRYTVLVTVKLGAPTKSYRQQDE